MNSFEFDQKRRHLLMAALAAGTALPWESAFAQNKAVSITAISCPRRVQT
jgi:hypothetical protein